MKQKNEIRPHTYGLSLLLVVFLILCLLTFAAISIAEARNDLTAAQIRAEKNLAYQAASDMAELTIHEYTDEAVMNPDGALETLAFTVSIDDSDELDVEARLAGTAEAPRYIITRWQVMSNGGREVENTLNLMTDGRLGW